MSSFPFSRAMRIAASLGLSLLSPVVADERGITAADCNFLLHQDEFRTTQARIRRQAHDKATSVLRAATADATVDRRSIPQRNLIDTHIFDKLQTQGVRSAAAFPALTRTFDNGLATLIADLKSDGFLDDTLIVAMGEFGRTVGR